MGIIVDSDDKQEMVKGSTSAILKLFKRIERFVTIISPHSDLLNFEPELSTPQI
jgi:hypothetical protein